jgi:hypothetical protein
MQPCGQSVSCDSILSLAADQPSEVVRGSGDVSLLGSTS